MGVKLKFSIGILFFLFCVSTSMLGQEEEKHVFHKVLAGETIYGIAKHYNISIEDLQKFNPELKDGLKEGATLLIPSLPNVAETVSDIQNDTNFVYHQVKKQETLYSLSKTYGVSIIELEQYNPFLKDGLKIGQTIKIPKSIIHKEEEKVLSPDFIYHTVEPKETAYSLSKQYNVSIDSLYLLNEGTDQGLRIGQVLRFPKKGGDTVTYRVAGARLDTNMPPQKVQDEIGSDDRSKENADLVQKSDTSDYILYQVKTGDSFFSLKQQFGVSRDRLVALNPELKNGLEVGKYIIIPNVKDSKETKDVSWLDKLFREVEKEDLPQEPIDVKQAEDDKLKLNDSIPFLNKARDTVVVDLSKNYQVALMLPFYSNTAIVDSAITEKPEIDKKSIMALDFYNGFFMAADTLSKKGMHITLRVLDTKGSLFKVKEQVKDLDTYPLDMVVGPLYGKNVEYVAEAFSSKDIPVISPLSKAVEVAKHPNLIQCIPGDKESTIKTSEIIDDYFTNANVVFVHSGTTNEREEVKKIKAGIGAREYGRFFKEVITTDDEMVSKNDVTSLLESGGKNVFVVVTENNVLISDLLNKLRSSRDTSIYILGSSKLAKSSLLELDYLNKLNLTMPDITFIDYEDEATNNFIEVYRERYYAEPSRYAFQGYDIGMYFLEKLWKEGRFFRDNMESTSSMLNMGFAMKKIENGGYQNQYFYVTGIRNFSLIKL